MSEPLQVCDACDANEHRDCDGTSDGEEPCGCDHAYQGNGVEEGDYRVTWTIEVSADNAREALGRALDCLLASRTEADHFEIEDHAGVKVTLRASEAE